jgi:hypothetical protein
VDQWVSSIDCERRLGQGHWSSVWAQLQFDNCRVIVLAVPCMCGDYEFGKEACTVVAS